MTDNIKPVLTDGLLYIGDNGRVFHGKCAGMSARYSGYDISGQRVRRITSAQARDYGLDCESCGRIEVDDSEPKGVPRA